MTRHVYDSVEDAIYAVAHFGTVSMKAQANALGMPEPRYRDLVDPNRKPNFPATLVAPQMRASGDAATVRTICRDAGGLYVQLPTIAGDAREIVAALGESLREMGEATALITTQLSDGAMTKLEAADAIREINQAVEKIQGLRLLLQQRIDVSPIARVR